MMQREMDTLKCIEDFQQLISEHLQKYSHLYSGAARWDEDEADFMMFERILREKYPIEQFRFMYSVEEEFPEQKPPEDFNHNVKVFHDW